jgi:hypothetical protein
MPRSFLRLVIAIALALAVPMQGFAAAAGAICMAVGHHDAAPAHDSHDAGHQHGDQHEQPADSSAHCPPCAACCASAAIAPSAMLLQPDERTEVLNALAPPLFAGIHRKLLDRPPLAL